MASPKRMNHAPQGPLRLRLYMATRRQIPECRRALSEAGGGEAARPYDRSRGTHLPPQVAWIVEADCIGCTKCIQACPVDAIVGGAKHMHTVIAPLCTGCELCVPACPVDCIELRVVG